MYILTPGRIPGIYSAPLKVADNIVYAGAGTPFPVNTNEQRKVSGETFKSIVKDDSELEIKTCNNLLCKNVIIKGLYDQGYKINIYPNLEAFFNTTRTDSKSLFTHCQESLITIIELNVY